MPGFDDYVKDITGLQKGPGTVTTHAQWRDLVRWYGDALREFVEKTAFPAKLPAKLDAQKKKLNRIASPWPGIGSAVGGTVDADYLGRELQQFADEAARQHKRGQDDRKDGHGDDASEAFVDAAASDFRAALACVALGGATPDYSKIDVITASLNYAIKLTEAAQNLADAAANEDAGDIAEKAAQALVGHVFADIASRELASLEAGVHAKGITLNAASKKAVDAAKTAATAALDKAVTELKNYEKP
jgi:hypothetical protein